MTNRTHADNPEKSRGIECKERLAGSHLSEKQRIGDMTRVIPYSTYYTPTEGENDDTVTKYADGDGCCEDTSWGKREPLIVSFGTDNAVPYAFY
jgi:hypothetical protein